MTDHDHERIAEQLRADLRTHADSAATPDLLAGSLRQAGKIRNRRRGVIAGVAGVSILVLGIGGITWNPLQRYDPAPPPVASAPASELYAPPPTLVPVPVPPEVDLDLSKLEAGEPPKIDYVQEGVWHSADGGETRLDFATADGFNYAEKYYRQPSGLLAWLGTDTETLSVIKYPVDGELSTTTTTIVDEPYDFFSGPQGSVFWTVRPDPGTSAGEDISVKQLRDNGTVHDYGEVTAQAGENGLRIAATASYIYTMQDETTVVRIPITDANGWPAESLGATEVLPDATSLITAGPAADRVAVRNQDECVDVLDGTTLDIQWTSCDWAPTIFSADGRYAFAIDRVDNKRAALLDAATGALLVDFPSWTDFEARGAMSFDDDGNLNFVLTQPPADPGGLDESAIVACSPAGECWRATDLIEQPDSTPAKVLSVTSRSR